VGRVVDDQVDHLGADLRVEDLDEVRPIGLVDAVVGPHHVAQSLLLDVPDEGRCRFATKLDGDQLLRIVQLAQECGAATSVDAELDDDPRLERPAQLQVALDEVPVLHHRQAIRRHLGEAEGNGELDVPDLEQASPMKVAFAVMASAVVRDSRAGTLVVPVPRSRPAQVSRPRSGTSRLARSSK
jgi:hypothetical protein